MSKPTQCGAPGPRPSAKSPTTPATVARVQGAVADRNGGGVPRGSYVGRMQKTVAKRPNNPVIPPPRSKNMLHQSNQNDDNHSNQLNPNHDAYWRSRGENGRPDDWKVRVSLTTPLRTD